MDPRLTDRIGKLPVEITADCGVRWIPWTLEKNEQGLLTKRPWGSTRNPIHYKQWVPGVSDLPRNTEEGIGIIFHGGVRIGDDILVGIDLDACVTFDGAIVDWAQRIIDLFPGCYCEYSPSRRGLHVLILVQNPPISGGVVTKGVDLPKLIERDEMPLKKNPEAQIFFDSGYLSVTGEALKGHAELTRIEDLRPLCEMFGWEPSAKSKDADLPIGDTNIATPTAAELRQRIEAQPNGKQLIAADWKACGKPSASEAYGQLVKRALIAAAFKGCVVVEFLLTETDWPEGDFVSKDPSRYALRRWVVDDVIRGEKHARNWVAEQERKTGIAFGTVEVQDDTGGPPASKSEPKTLTRFKSARKVRQRLGSFRFSIEGLLPEQGLGLLYSEQGVGKSTLAVSLAVAMAAGLPNWGGREMIGEPRCVAFCGGEGISGLAGRIEAQAMDLGLEDVEPLLERAQMTEGAARLTDPKDVRDLIEQLDAYVEEVGIPLGMLIFDTLNRNSGDADEDKAQDMAKLIEPADRIAKHFGCLVLFLHHCPHTKPGQKPRPRGSSTLPGAADVSIGLMRGRKSGQFSVFCHKAKDFQDFPDFAGQIREAFIPELDPDTGAIDESLPKISTPIFRHCVFEAEEMRQSRERKLFDLLTAHSGKFVTKAVLIEETKLSRFILQRTTQSFVERGLFTCSGGKTRPVLTATGHPLEEHPEVKFELTD